MKKRYFWLAVSGVLLVLLALMPVRSLAQPNYIAQAYAFISQGSSLGPPNGLNKLTAENPAYGARGCAYKVAETNLAEAAKIMMQVAQTLVTFARTTTETRRDINPRDPTKYFRDQYYQSAIHQMMAVRDFLKRMAAAQPAQAATLAIQAATFFYNSMPGDDAYRSNYLEHAKLFLHVGNYSALYFARQVKDNNQKRALINQIKAQRTAWGF